MTAEALRALWNRRPFVPLKVKTSSGQVLEVRHPEMMSFAKSALVVVHPDADGSPSDRTEFISYLHIVSVETAAGSAA